MEDVSQKYKEGFNSGYLLAKHEPELASTLFKSVNEHSDYFKGMNSGKQEFEKEKNKQQSFDKTNIDAKDIPKDKDREL